MKVRPWGQKPDPIDVALDAVDQAIEEHQRARERAERAIESNRIKEERRGA